MNNPHQFIVVEGPIGVGKSSLVKRIAESLGMDTFLEKPADNPFLERFYQDPRGAALPTQLSFLFQRAQQYQQLRQQDLFHPATVADFMVDKDRLFAQTTLDDDEYHLYEQVYKNLSMDAPTPDLVVYLQAPTEVLLQRIENRGIGYEQGIDADYLGRLSEAYASYFLSYRAAPLLIVNAAEINPVENDEDYNSLLERIRKTHSGVQYFNPIAAATVHSEDSFNF